MDEHLKETDENSYRERFLELLNDHNSLRSSEYFALARFYEFGLWIKKARQLLTDAQQDELDKVLTDQAELAAMALRCPRCGKLLVRPARGHDGDAYRCSCGVRIFGPKVSNEPDPGAGQVSGPVTDQQMKDREAAHEQP